MQSDDKPIVSKRPFFKYDPLSSVIVTAFVFLLSQILAGIIINTYPSLKNWTGDQGEQWVNNSVIAQFVYILLAEFFSVWFVLRVIRKIKIKPREIGLKMLALKDVVYALAAYAAYFVVYIAAMIILSHIFNLNTEQAQKLGFDGVKGRQLYLVFISLVVLPPIAEEIMFRGLLFSGLRRKFKYVYAVIATSALFGVAHLQFGSGEPLLWPAAIDTFTLSCVLCVLREKTDSLSPGIILHALKNSVAFIALYHTKF